MACATHNIPPPIFSCHSALLRFVLSLKNGWIALVQQSPTGGGRDFVLRGLFGDTWRRSAGPHWRLLMTTTRWRPGSLLKTLRCAGRPPNIVGWPSGPPVRSPGLLWLDLQEHSRERTSIYPACSPDAHGGVPVLGREEHPQRCVCVSV